ncbi:MAG: DUF4292 domain-containing protein [Salibacteraceae bacterium]
MKKVFLILFVLSTAITGCKSSQKANQNKGGKVGSKKVVEIVENITSEEAKVPKFLSFKADASINMDKTNQSVKLSVRMVKDSAIWISITSFKYEAIRILATPDSIKFLNRKEKKYYSGDYSFVQNKMGVELGFNEVQSLLYGHSFGLKKAESISKRNDKNHYVLSTLSKREAKNVEKGKEWQTDDVEVLFTNWINPENFKTEKVNMKDINTENNASIQYLTFENISNFLLLSSFKMNIIAKTNTDVEVKMNKFNVEGPLKFPFKISSKYVPITE